MHGYSSAIMWGAFTILLLVLLLKNSNNSTASNNTTINDYNDNYSSNNGESTIKKIFLFIWDFFIKALAWVIFLGIAGIILWFLYETYSFIADDITNSSSTQQTSIKGKLIVDGDYLPSYRGTYLFTAEANKTYRIKITGCGVQRSFDNEYGKYTMRFCSDGRYPSASPQYTITNDSFYSSYKKKFLFPAEYVDKAILITQHIDGSKSFIIAGNSLKIMKLESGSKVFLSLNGPNAIDDPIFGTGWRVVVTEE